LSLLEIAFGCLVDIKELLRVEVDHREPTALDLNHDAVASTKGMKRIRDRKLHASGLSGDKRFGPIQAIAKLAAHDLTPHQLLIGTQRVLYVAFAVGKEIRVDVDQLDDPV
jgi:hypothetical protein